MTPHTSPPTVLTARTPEDLIAMVPYILGFRPEQSMVMLTFGAEQPTFHARVDLPSAGDEVPEMVAALVEPVMRHPVARAVLLAFTDDPELAAGALRLLAAGLEAVGVTIVESLRVSGDRWFPMSGRPGDVRDGVVFDATSHRFAAQAVLDGRVTLDSREELADTLVGTDLEAIERVEEGVLQAVVRRADLDRASEARWLQFVVTKHLADGEGLTPDEAGRLLVACEEVCLRDVVWGLMTRETADRHVELWRDLVRRSPADLELVPAAFLAFAAWLGGHGALAWCALDRAALIDPEYKMVQLLSSVLEQALPPGVWEPVTDLPVLLDGA